MKKWKIKTHLPIKYDIKTVNNIFDVNNDELIKNFNNKRVLIFADKNVCNIYGNDIENYFKHNDFDYNIIPIKSFEKDKTVEMLLNVLSIIEQFKIERKEAILAIGGGVILDVVGLASSLYRRNIPYIKIPTTLLGMVDVSVAAKTGINFIDQRNRLGNYYPPQTVYIDKSFLKSLDNIEISSACGEILKIALIKDRKLFLTLEKYCSELYNTKFDHIKANKVINKSITDMKKELENNLFEKKLKRCVDFGHSFSPYIEMLSLKNEEVISLTHGQAVTLDIIFSSIISYNRNILKMKDIKRIIAIIKKVNLPTFHEYFIDQQLLVKALSETIKHRNGNQYLPIPTKIGKYKFINDLTFKEITDAIKIFEEINK